MSIVEEMLSKAKAKEPDVLVAPEVEAEFVPVDIKDLDDDEFSEEDLPAEEDGVELSDPALTALNVLSIVANKKYPYGGFFEDDADETRKEWGGEDTPNPYSEQDDE
jgi:hypothetical protein